MHYQFPGFTIAYAVSVVLCFISAGMAWKRRANSGSIPFALLMMSLTIWSFASIFEAGAMTVNGKIFWSKCQYLGITTVSPLWIIFSAEYTGRNKILTDKTRWMIWIIPQATLVLALTNELHHLIWTDVSVVLDVFHLGYYTHGSMFFAHTVFSYVCLLIGTIWLVKSFLKGQNFLDCQYIIYSENDPDTWA